MTQDELASCIGLTRTSIANIESGRQKLLLHTLIRISNCLAASAAEILQSFEPDDTFTLPKDLPAHVRNWIVQSIGSPHKHSRK